LPIDVTYHSIDANKIFGALCPRRKDNIAERLSVVVGAEVIAVAVGEHVGQVEKLGNQLLQTQLVTVNDQFSSNTNIES